MPEWSGGGTSFRSWYFRFSCGSPRCRIMGATPAQLIAWVSERDSEPSGWLPTSMTISSSAPACAASSAFHRPGAGSLARVAASVALRVPMEASRVRTISEARGLLPRSSSRRGRPHPRLTACGRPTTADGSGARRPDPRWPPSRVAWPAASRPCRRDDVQAAGSTGFVPQPRPSALTGPPQGRRNDRSAIRPGLSRPAPGRG